MESTPDDRLCDICATIPFFELHTKAQRSNISGYPGNRNSVDVKGLSWSFGKVSDVRGRGYCPFCRLICEGLERNLSDNYNIEITWGRGRHRDAFSCVWFPLGTLITFLEIRHRFLERRIDVSRVHQWLSICSEHHSNCLPHRSTPEVELANFRVIDVRQKRIVALPNSIRYVALSYVWGQVDTFRLLKRNLKDLMKSEGLTRNWEKLPRTIRDVVLFTEAIGERYLWVDTLCLIQDDDHDKIPGIKHMDVIYSRAFCTIIAASGEDANAGIPGWGLIRRRAQHVSEVLPGVNLVLTRGMNTYLKQTRYNKRAWTFQEYFLSPRRIIFVNSQVYYLCHRCYWREEDAEVRDVMNNSMSGDDENNMSLLGTTWSYDKMDTHGMLTMLLYHYTTRQLTYESDVLNAMAGICRALSFRCKCSFFQGMPVAAFDPYLIFDTVDRVAKRRHGFPSYSWTGWHGQIRFQDIIPSHLSENIRKMNIWLSNHTWIVWYKYEPATGKVSLIWDINQNPDFLEATENDIGYRNGRSIRPKSAKRGLYVNDPTTEPSPRYHIIDGTQYSYTLLQFWTVAVYFNITHSSEYEFRISDRNGDLCGWLRKTNASIDARIEESVELILLSEHWRYDSGNAQDISTSAQEYMGESPVAESRSRERECVGPFYALWIRWEGGVAERVGYMTISLANVEESLEPGPIWKEILLA